jgi:hypothetical protein
LVTYFLLPVDLISSRFDVAAASFLSSPFSVFSLGFRLGLGLGLSFDVAAASFLSSPFSVAYYCACIITIIVILCIGKFSRFFHMRDDDIIVDLTLFLARFINSFKLFQ